MNNAAKKLDAEIAEQPKASLEVVKKDEKEVPEEIRKLLTERENLRKNKKYDEADKIREKIIEMGFNVEDKS